MEKSIIVIESEGKIDALPWIAEGYLEAVCKPVTLGWNQLLALNNFSGFHDSQWAWYLQTKFYLYLIIILTGC